MCKSCGCGGEGRKHAQIIFHVEGYKADNVKDVENFLLNLPGVYHVHIHAHDGQTTIGYNPSDTSIVDIANSLTTYGLKAVV